MMGKMLIRLLAPWLAFFEGPAMARERLDPWDYGANHSNGDWYSFIVIVLIIAVIVLASTLHRAEKERDDLMKRRIELEEKQKAVSPPP